MGANAVAQKSSLFAFPQQAHSKERPRPPSTIRHTHVNREPTNKHTSAGTLAPSVRGKWVPTTGTLRHDRRIHDQPEGLPLSRPESHCELCFKPSTDSRHLKTDLHEVVDDPCKEEAVDDLEHVIVEETTSEPP